MPRAKPSAWQPKGLEGFDTCGLYSDDDLVKLITHHLGTHSKKRQEKSWSNCVTSPGFCGRITERGRLTVKKKRACES
jgi:hypothetical protein